jgi:hypothetical protein
VFYLGLEEKRAEVKRHFAAMGAKPEDDVYFWVAPSPEHGLELLRAAVARVRPVLVIIDPLFRMIRVKDSNEYAQMTAAMDPILTLARSTGAHVLVTHHASKGDRSGGDSVLGSTAIFGSVDSTLILKRTERYRTLTTIQRYGEDLEEVTLVLDPETRAVNLGESRQDADQSEAEGAILDALRGAAAPMTEPEIGEAVEGRTSLKRKALRALYAAGKVTRTGRGGKGDPFLYAAENACSLVPGISREQENENPESHANPRQHGPDACSRDSADSAGGTEGREQAFDPGAELDAEVL